MPDTEARLRAALEPFAKWIKQMDDIAGIENAIVHSDDCPCFRCDDAVVTFGDFRRAREAYEALSTPPAPAAEPQDAQYRCLWEERMVWPNSPDGFMWRPCSGRVFESIILAQSQRGNLLTDPKFRHVQIEARPKSDKAWPWPWDASSSSVEPPSASEAAIRAEQHIDSRQVSRDFLLLPYHRKVEIMRSLGVIDPKDGTDLPHSIWIECMMRVRDAGLLPQLVAAIERGQSAECGEDKR